MITTITKSNKKTPDKSSLYTEFILWTAMPYEEKVNLGLEWQQDFAAFHKVTEGTLSRWKHRADFEQRVDAIIKIWATDKTPNVVHAIYRAAIKGNPYSQQLWLGYFKGYNPKKIEEETKKVVLSVGDIRYAIEQLPEQLKDKHYGYLRELTEDLNAVRNARDVEDDHWEQQPQIAIPNETDIDAQYVPNESRPDEVANSHICSVQKNMERYVSQNYNQSTARGWEE